jgi:hypothetical protein
MKKPPIVERREIKAPPIKKVKVTQCPTMYADGALRDERVRKTGKCRISNGDYNGSWKI